MFLGYETLPRVPVFGERQGDVLSRGASSVQESVVCRWLGRLGQAFFRARTASVPAVRISETAEVEFDPIPILSDSRNGSCNRFLA
jgi:hypothetical protein